MRTDYLIVGQGLAGSLLAWELLARGKQVLVVDRDEPVTSSKIAAGIVTPVTGQRVAPSWRIDEMLDRSRRLYRHVEQETGEWLYHPASIARLLASEDEERRWKKKLAENGGQFLEHTAPLEIDDSVYNTEFGGFEMRTAGWLDVPRFLEVTRQALLERAGYAIANLRPEEIDVSAGGVKWKNIEADTVVFCQGWEGNRNSFFDWIPFRSAKGEILDLECEGDLPGDDTERIINRAGWLLRSGNLFRAGSTYDWDTTLADAHKTTDAGKVEILEKVGAMFRRKPEFRVTAHRAAVRPIIRESRGLIGVHPAPELHNRVAFFNGLGSKGVLNGPFIARQLAEHLVNRAPIEEVLDLRQNF
jgi:glycine/D-amino acid oxidase-like deaminating enzyme